MPFPLAAMLIMSALGGLGSAAGFAGQKRANNQQFQLGEEQNALQESQLNPFRGALSQQSALEAIDRQQNTTPRAVTPNGPGGFSSVTGGQYSMSPELMQFLTELRKRIASGQAANPAITPGYRDHQPNLGTASSNTDVLADGSRYDPNLRMWMPPPQQQA